ncbi:hypothetical protein RHSIM_Rhsim04G0222600 [Rhododendron simsii]|uniref:Uncharacterized protein n=1 Tax=Rhododendron simsii TaxID=118357 RepID=A0A834H4I5_RHOSS|nr:hypothetical protein RHSIM_Rhsim04G0222600 [Rhododendron simsii]
MACSTDGSSVSGSHLDGEVSSRIISDTSDCSPSNCDLSDSLSGICCYPPKFSLSGSSKENGKLENEMFCEEWLDEKMGFDSWIVVDENTGSDPYATISEALAFDFRESDSIDIAGSPEAFNPLSDLSGDYDSHIRSLLYGQCCHGYALYAHVLPNAPTFPYKRPWNTVSQSMLIKQGSHIITNGVVLGSTYNSMTDSKPFNCLRLEEKRKARETGTFFPKSELNGCSCRERSPQGRGKKQAPANHRQVQRHTRINGSGPTLPEKKLSEEVACEVPRGGKSGLNSNDEEFCISSKKLEFGSLGQLSEQLSLTALEKCYSWASTPSLVLKVKSSKTEVGNNEQRWGNLLYPKVFKA